MRLSIIMIAVLAMMGCSQGEKDAKKTGTPQIQVDAQWFDYYIPLQEAMAADDFEKATAAAKTLHEHSTGEAKTLVAAAAAAADMTALRTAFQPFSEAAAKQTLPEGVVVAYCPMAFNDTGAHWVQKDGIVMNPYFGAEMLNCGMIKREKKGQQQH